MKRTFTFLMMSLFLCVGMVKADVTDLPQITTDLENPIYYTIYNTRSSQPGGLMYYAGDAVGLKDGCSSFGDKYKFFFTGSHDALYIHNAATANKLASVDSWTAEGTEWAVGVSPKGNGLAIGPKGGLNGNGCINEKNYETAANTSDFTTWSANDEGSIFVMELAEGYVFPMTDLFYVIECPLFEKAQGVKKALYVNAEGNAAWATEDLANLNYYWIPTVKEDGTAALKNLGTNKYLSNTDGVMADEAVYATINALGANSFNIKFGGNALHANGHGGGNGASGGLTSWGGAAGSASAWQFVQREDPTKLQEAVVTYNLTYGDEVKYTQTVTTLVGEEWPAITVALPYTVSATKPEGAIAAEDLTDGAVTKEIALTIGELPFVAAADVESIDTWYYVKMHSNTPKYIQYLTDQTYLEWVDAEKDETAKDTYAWAFVGNIFDGFKVVNKAAAKAMQSTADGAVVLVDYADASQYVLAATRETSEAAKSGFCLRRPDANKECLNASAGKVAHWWDNDAGSTFMLEVVENEPEVDENDYTSYIVNADLATEEGWDATGTKGISGGMVKVASESAFDFNQTITLPAGQYKVTAKAAYRYTDSEQGEYDAIQAGTETHLVKLYAETSSYKYEGDVMNRWEGASDTDYANGDGSKTVNGKFVPNSSNAVLAWFNAGQYVNELVFNVQEEGAVKIGITRVGGVSGDYTNIGAWTLTRLGDAEADPKEEEPTPDPEKPEIGDVTSKYLVNADFETPSAQDGGAINTPPGWTMTYDLGGWLDGSTRLSENPGNDASQCFNVWAGEFRSADIYQKPVLPAGKYKLTVGFYSDGAAERYAYATVGGTTVKSATPTPGSWDFVDVEFINPTDGEVTLGAVSKGWFQIDNVTLEYLGEVNKDDIVSAYNEALEKAQALMGQKMDGTVSTELAAAIAAYGSLTADNSVEELESATAAISVKVAAAETSANAYANNKAAIDAMFALLESTNVYTAEACATYTALAEEYLAQYEAGTLEDVVDNPAAIHGWHASVDYDDLLLSAFGVKDFDDALHINTWSTEGETDGSDFKVPFYEYWTGDGESLGVATKTATVTGLTPGRSYSVEAWVRTRAKNGVAAADATGITLSVGDGEAVDVTEGEVVGESQFAHAVYTAVGKADAEGNLIINFNVLADNNVSWLSFKNIKYAEYGGETAVESVESQAEAVIYDLSGRRVQKMTKGLYIVNGRKVIK